MMNNIESSQQNPEKKGDVWSEIEAVTESAITDADTLEQEEKVARWLPASLDPHDIHALHRQLEKNAEAYIEQLETISVALIRVFDELRAEVARYCEHEGEETLEFQELRIAITRRWHTITTLAVDPVQSASEGLVPDLVGYSDPEKAIRYEELMVEDREKTMAQAEKLRSDNSNVAVEWEAALRVIDDRREQFEKLKELMKVRLTQLQSERSSDEVVAIVKSSFDEIDPKLDFPSRNVAESIIYNNLLRDLIEDFG